MNKSLKNVLDFHKVYGQPIPRNPGFPAEDRIALRLRLMEEELKEVREAIEKGDLPNLGKELGDLLYVVNGAVIEFGLSEKMEEIEDAVHASNMSKLDDNGKPIYKPNGKVAKGPNYFEPDIKAILDTPTVLKFEDLGVKNYFIFEDMEFFKTSSDQAVEQTDSIKSRRIFTFNGNCLVRPK